MICAVYSQPSDPDYIVTGSFFFSSHDLKGTVHINNHVHVNAPEFAKGYFPSAVPGRSGKEH